MQKVEYTSFFHLLSLTSRTAQYGRDDPWIVPHWAQQIKKAQPAARYYQIAPAGHCPHHETPTAVNSMMKRWIDEVEAERESELLRTVEENEEYVFNDLVGDVTVKCLDGKPTNLLERILVALS